jgi:hypothetical protein
VAFLALLEILPVPEVFQHHHARVAFSALEQERPSADIRS